MKKEVFSFSDISRSPRETQALGNNVSNLILALPKLEHARVFGLRGNLGVGKTTFMKGLAKGFNVKKNITSPTFVILQRFKLKNKFYKNLFHIDAYRLSSFSNIHLLEIDKIIEDNKNIVFIEWPQNIKSKNLKLCGFISLRHKKEMERNISIKIKK